MLVCKDCRLPQTKFITLEGVYLPRYLMSYQNTHPMPSFSFCCLQMVVQSQDITIIHIHAFIPYPCRLLQTDHAQAKYAPNHPRIIIL